MNPFVTGAGRVPSGFIIQISRMFVDMPREKAILLPSGDHAGCQSPRVLLVSAFGFDPSASITQMAMFPSRSLVNAIFIPSGDQAGSVSCDGLLVMRTWFDPSA